ncbi:molybdenum cofactor synthesis domain-containing protein [Halorubellus sp. PRR65]|uniref:MogA/MoaB family molybdenum cofactor biosynthesis protein n=1 Tax=Halorubellus sp. PRR65 TaxID=3098148 RepID=UPI002B25DDE0|nr:molybdenum cofactor synthesis domain-containing protein [Halorubellus sp. PRR65]
MTDGERGQEPTSTGGDGAHAGDHAADSERGHDHGADGDHGHHDHGADDAHDHHADDAAGVGAAVVTVSSSRSLDDDPSGDAIAAALERDGHEVVTRELVRDEFDNVQGAVARLVKRNDVDVVVTTGGTGVTPDDVTPEAVEPLLDKHLPGFGEEFRRRSVEAVGEMGMLSRATAGVADGTVVAVLPGSESAATTGTTLLLTVLGHLVGLATPDAAE